MARASLEASPLLNEVKQPARRYASRLDELPRIESVVRGLRHIRSFPFFARNDGMPHRRRQACEKTYRASIGLSVSQKSKDNLRAAPCAEMSAPGKHRCQHDAIGTAVAGMSYKDVRTSRIDAGVSADLERLARLAAQFEPDK